MLSFIFQIPEASQKINAIYLFGSAVRGELQDHSDIDLFIECTLQHEKRVEQLVNSGIAKFIVSQDFQKWKLLRYTYPFSIQVGRLQEWELKLSIASEGILLYSNKSILTLGKRHVLFTISLPKSKKAYIKLRRTLFGRDEEFYQDTGIIHALQGKKISSTVFILPQDQQTKMREILDTSHVEFSMTQIILQES